MEMGRLTAKLRDAVQVCFLVEGNEIKRYRNIEIPDELKKLEYQDFKFDVPLSGAITFKIMFEPGVLPEKLPQMRERRTRIPKEALVAVLNEASAATTVKENEETTPEITAIMAIQDDFVKEMLEAQVASKGADYMVEVQADENVTQEGVTEPETQETEPAKKPAMKPKKASAMGSN